LECLKARRRKKQCENLKDRTIFMLLKPLMTMTNKVQTVTIKNTTVVLPKQSQGEKITTLLMGLPGTRQLIHPMVVQTTLPQHLKNSTLRQRRIRESKF
jgi:hypothetical protein